MNSSDRDALAQVLASLPIGQSNRIPPPFWTEFIDDAQHSIETPREMLEDFFTELLIDAKSPERAVSSILVLGVDHALQHLCASDNLGDQELHQRMVADIIAISIVHRWETSNEDRRPIYDAMSPEGIQKILLGNPGIEEEELMMESCQQVGEHLIVLADAPPNRQTSQQKYSAWGAYWWYRQFVYLSVARMRQGWSKPLANLGLDAAESGAAAEAYQKALGSPEQAQWHP